jgi:hypothetical protein
MRQPGPGLPAFPRLGGEDPGEGELRDALKSHFSKSKFIVAVCQHSKIINEL